MHRIDLPLLLQGRAIKYLWAGSCRPCWSASGSAMPLELHSCRCAARAISATCLSIVKETVRTHETFTSMRHCELRPSFGFTESYSACSEYGRGPIPKSTSAACRCLTAPQGSRCSEALLVQSALQGVDAVESV